MSPFVLIREDLRSASTHTLPSAEISYHLGVSCFFKNKINSESITQRKPMESEFVVLQLSESFPVCWKEHGSIFNFLLLKMLFVHAPTIIWLELFLCLL